jgi:polyphenol oxidase
LNPGWLTPNWPAPPNIRVLSSFRGGGVSSGTYASLNLGDHVGDLPEAVLQNRRNLKASAGLPAEPEWLSQVHGVNVADLDTLAPRATADAAVARAPGRICAILTADCMPLVFATESGDAVAAAHAGWRGLSAGVIEETVKALQAPAAQLLVWLGPAIGASHFEVGEEVRAEFLKGDPECLDAFKLNSRGRYLADLALLARRRLSALGISRIYESGECTYTQADRYFSHRRDGVTGRQVTLIWRDA